MDHLQLQWPGGALILKIMIAVAIASLGPYVLFKTVTDANSALVPCNNQCTLVAGNKRKSVYMRNGDPIIWGHGPDISFTKADGFLQRHTCNYKQIDCNASMDVCTDDLAPVLPVLPFCQGLSQTEMQDQCSSDATLGSVQNRIERSSEAIIFLKSIIMYSASQAVHDVLVVCQASEDTTLCCHLVCYMLLLWLNVSAWQLAGKLNSFAHVELFDGCGCYYSWQPIWVLLACTVPLKLV